MASLICDKCGILAIVSGHDVSFLDFTKGFDAHHVVLIASGNVFAGFEAI